MNIVELMNLTHQVSLQVNRLFLVVHKDVTVQLLKV